MPASPFDDWDSIVAETTDEFCRAFRDERSFHGRFARTVAFGAFPHGVDPHDPRVLEIQRRCREVLAVESQPPAAG
ncbi:MAG TPA: hypothetical protein VLW85_16590 [Myxococcales bacterium]|nr:hypothetical protein [Myxococcales bacterium]